MTGVPVETEKAIRYIQTLDLARCQGQWLQVPEHARKVEKHAPHRNILVLTARAEASAATTAFSEQSSTFRPLISSLVDAITKPNPYPEDSFQAIVCLSWLHWLLQEPEQALAQLVEDPVTAYDTAATERARSREWIKVCALKYAYIKGFTLEKSNLPNEAAIAYYSALPLLSDVSRNVALGSMPREFRLWAERLLSRCVAYTLKAQPLDENTEYGRLLQIFHHWAALFNFHPTDSKTGLQAPQTTPDFELGQEVEYTRWNMWMSYYTILSQILKRGFVYSISYSDSNPNVFTAPSNYTAEEYRDSRLKQRKELKNVENCIETKLLEETSFPKAHVRNERVENWADAIMDNWKIMCGSSWSDADLGQGGKNAIAKGVLDILYRAATKTFHSTQILRHLFTVHAYLAEFDLALKALDSYLELYTRGKARTEKTGEIDFSLDHEDKVLWILSEAISILCRFGGRKEAEKAKDIAAKLRLWTEEWDTEPQIQEATTNEPNGLNGSGNITEPIVKPVSGSIISVAYHALGTSEAHWGRLTYEASTRTQHQNKAQEYFRLALQRKYRNSRNLDYLYSLAILMAEMRDIPGSIKVVKQALAEGANQGTSEDDFQKERKLIRFWHLLTLLLSARSDLLNAAKASNAAFEQFQDPGMLFGHQEYRSEHLNDTEKTNSPALIDHMNPFEKVGVLEVKMTQVALLEAFEGPASAVEASPDLLALYVRLFGDLRDMEPMKTSGEAKVPKSRVGSLRASLFKRARSRKVDNPRINVGPPQTAQPPQTAILQTVQTAVAFPRPSTAGTSTAAPTIQVTDTSSSGIVEARGRPTTNGISGRPKSGVYDGTKNADGRLVQRSRSRSKIRKRNSVRDSMESFRPPSPTANYDENSPENAEAQQINGVSSVSVRNSVQSFARPGTSTSTATRTTVAHRNKRESSMSMKSTASDTTSVLAGMVIGRAASPAPAFPNITDRRHKLSVLVELWLFVSGMYMRAEQFEDSKDAINEAAHLVSKFELELSRATSSAKAFANSGWGGGRSIDQMWGDIWTQRGELAKSSDFPHDAINFFEKAVGYWPNHARAIVGLASLLLDLYSEIITPDAPEDRPPPFLTATNYITNSGSATNSTTTASATPAPPSLSRHQTGQSIPLSIASANTSTSNNNNPSTTNNNNLPTDTHPTTDSPAETTPDLLNRLAARDRAYFLLSTLTKLGVGWDYSEAWFALARVYEESGQVEKAKEVLWWCVELEDSRPLRPWGCVGLNGFLL
ncbi:hypothetical protein BT63DRAFT_425206 [Microthyrium microscopicum]|uniref:Filamentation protein-like protein n=1 Tax=Microthyrium microscopicum TaxID=703497 RepID=A0A6A6UDM7_9PEZI|nr:hypothetical protein BT63DRAFT_425206 [Microthyrium microscopicum]